MSKHKKKSRLKQGKVDDCQFIVYTDGGCAFNPGGPGGCGAVIIDRETGEIIELSEGYVSSTNNRMEIMAVILAFSAIPDGKNVMLYSDSQYVLNTINGYFAAKTNTDLWNKLFKLLRGKEVFLRWVKGHNGDEFNERCDALATEAMSKEALLVDEGYSYIPSRIQPQGTVENKGGAMAVKISVPDGLSEYFEQSLSERFAKDECKKQIKKLNSAKNHSFKGFANVKTGGIDKWSRVSEIELEELCGNDIYSLIKEYLSNDKDISSAMKWYCRGFSISNAIRKVLVDHEINQNAMLLKKKNRWEY